MTSVYGPIITLMLLVSWPWFANAQWTALVERHQRPTIQDIAATTTHSDAKETDELLMIGNTERIQWIKNNPEKVINLLLNFERAFPGGTYAFLGRDAVFIADLLTAFYHALGQADRTLRLDASGSSIDSSSNEQLLAFLKDHRFDINAIKNSQSYVIIDGTSFKKNLNYLSQIRRLIEVGYSAAVAAGIPPHLLARRLNAMNTKDPYINQNTIGEIRLDEYFKREEAQMGPQGPRMILTSPFPALLTHGLQWHDSFGVLQKDQSGSLTGTPGTLATPGDRRIILGELLQLFQITRTSEFKALAQNVANTNNLNISTRTVLEPLNPEKPAPILTDKEKDLYQLSRLKKESLDLERIKELVTKQVARNDLDAWELVEVLQSGKPPKKEYQPYFEFLDRLWIQQAKHFADLNPPIDLVRTARRNVVSAEASTAIIKSLLPKATNADSFLAVMDPLVEMPSEGYQNLLNMIWLEHRHHFEALGPNSSQIERARLMSQNQCQISLNRNSQPEGHL